MPYSLELYEYFKAAYLADVILDFSNQEMAKRKQRQLLAFRRQHRPNLFENDLRLFNSVKISVHNTKLYLTT